MPMTPSKALAEFHSKFGVPKASPAEGMTLRKLMISEEAKEVEEAEEYAHLLKELADLVYVCYAMADVFDWDLDEAFRRVHESNMSKLDENGKPIYREDGKVLKGPNYKAPDLGDLV